jgi:formamidopyrimidine-DNA glycosylase
MKERIACFRCKGHITNKQISEMSKRTRYIYCHACQKFIDEKYKIVVKK